MIEPVQGQKIKNKTRSTLDTSKHYRREGLILIITEKGPMETTTGTKKANDARD